MPTTITVLLVDDQAMVRRAFRRILEDESGITIVGEARDGTEAIRLARELRPRVVLMDFGIPGVNGLEATREISSLCPGTSVLVVSMYSDDVGMERAAAAGARGYVLKNADDVGLASAVKRVAAGELMFDGQSSQPHSKKRTRKLTAREHEVLQLTVEGMSSREIAGKLGLSVNTVGAHRANIMREFGVRKIAELVAFAVRSGLVRL